ncbi:aminodeoxychorismate synthase component I [Candidatus Saganbacteria bacterium]|nr:aminodeoxychorismate synthase component I [Candidatus Saganbacteria bacterium]
MESALAKGFHLAGFLSYEAGYAFEDTLREDKTYDFPLLHFGIYASPRSDIRRPTPLHQRWRGEERSEGVRSAKVNIDYESYSHDIESIKSHIASGDTYQITYCLKYKFDFTGDSYALYRQLLKEQPVPYPAYLETDEFKILSLSPELFLEKKGENIMTKPMKGTWHRGKTLWEDLWVKRKLHKDKKNRAENVMICDLERNDLGRICRPGSVVTPKLFEVARYKTLCQMTSTVRGKLDLQIKLLNLFSALFPTGSVTGAPKIRSMEIIRELEKEERRIYTGAIGWIAPNRDLFFNIPIRTLLLKDGRGEMGVGGGIVWDSTPEGEWEECRLKAEFLFNR